MTLPGVKLRHYQAVAIDYGTEWITHSLRKPQDRLLLAAPTGTGKSILLLGLQRCIDGMGYGSCTTWIVTPKVEIILSLLRWLGVNPDDLSEAAVIETALKWCITTPVRLRNALLAGKLTPPRYLLLDEAHHDAANTYQDIHALCGYCPAIGVTATPYRGTPKGTAAFREQWGDPIWCITYPEAVEQGVLSLPHCETVPLVDDDVIEIRNGELEIRAIEEAVISRLEHIAAMTHEWCVVGAYLYTWFDRPTMFAVPTLMCAQALHQRMEEDGIPCVSVDGNTPYAERQAAFSACINRKTALIQCQVVSEGVDLPIRRLVDLAPTLSPVRWLQQFGRITRPVAVGEASPHYVCTNRNLLRHGYLLDGCLPSRAIAESQQAFPPSTRGRLAVRVIGLEVLGRLEPVSIPLRDGCTATFYAIAATEGHKRVEYAVILHPARELPIWATRTNVKQENETVGYGKWRACEAPADLAGFASIPPKAVSDKQKAWWRRCAKGYGIADTFEPNRKQFAVLPVLSALRKRLA